MSMSTVEEIIGTGFTDDARTSHAPEGRYYTDPHVHQMELDRVFGYEWNYICHQSQLPEAGSYMVRNVGGESIYVIRGRDDEIRAFYNVCQHRGHQLLEGQGTVGKVVVCPYHAWSYSADGSLRGAPRMRDVPNFCKADVALTSIRTELVGGFVFINLDEDARPLGEMAPRFEPILRSMVAEPEALRHVKTSGFDIAANWKVVTENFLEAYHVEFSGPAHRALANIIDTDTYEFDISGRTIEYRAKGGANDALPYQANQTDAFADAAGPPFHQVFLFPHMTFSIFPGTNMLFVFNMAPNGVERCDEEILYFTLDAEVTEPTAEAEAYVSEQLNVEDVQLVESVHRGLRSRGYRPGRFMVDEEQRASWSEQFVHHFNLLNIMALERNRDIGRDTAPVAIES